MRTQTATAILYGASAVGFAALAAYSFHRTSTAAGESVWVGVGYAILAVLWAGLFVRSSVFSRPRKQ